MTTKQATWKPTPAELALLSKANIVRSCMVYVSGYLREVEDKRNNGDLDNAAAYVLLNYRIAQAVKLFKSWEQHFVNQAFPPKDETEETP